MSEAVFVLAHGQNQFFEELAAALCEELETLGMASRIERGPFPPVEEGCGYVLLPPHEWHWLESQHGPADLGLLPRTVLFCTEQPGTPHFADNADLAGRAAGLMDISRRSVREYGRRGVHADHFQLGYTPRWDRISEGAARDIDAAFLGCATERRLKHLGSYGDLLWPYRSRLVVSDNSRPNTVSTPGFLTGDDKLDLFARTRVLLNIHQTVEPYFEWVRMVEAISNGCLPVSEHSTDYAPLAAGEHLVFGAPEHLGHLAVGLLEDESRRAVMARQAREFLRTELPLRAAAERLAEHVDRAARAPLGAGYRPPAAVERLEGEPRRSQPVHTTDDEELSALRASVKGLRLDLTELRRSIALDRLQPGDSPGVHLDVRSPAWAQARPRVSVLVTLYNYASHIEAALDSVATSEFPDLEIVVVDDASGDGSADVVRAWIQRHPGLPVMLLRHAINRGLPHARNAALAFARGEFAFVLDADNEVYPRCLDRLVSALDNAPSAAFAYGLIERFDADGPAGLLGWESWNPDRLRVSNYIDAMALVRTARLRELDGYTTDRDLHGWEDYDLWCKIAETGGQGAHVQEIVARYRASPTSMLALTNISSTGAYAALARRHPSLMDGIEIPL